MASKVAAMPQPSEGGFVVLVIVLLLALAGVTAYAWTLRTRNAQKSRDLAEREQRLHNLVTHVPGVIYQYRRRADGTSHIPYASAGIQAIYGVAPEDVLKDASPIFANIHPDDLSEVVRSIEASAADLSTWRNQHRVILPGGRCIWIEGQSTPIRNPDGSTTWHGYIRDVTDIRNADHRLRLAASVFANSYEGIVITDADSVILDVNPSFSRITGYSADEVIGNTPRILNSGRQQPAFYEQMWAAIRDADHWRGEIWNRRKNGEVYVEMLAISAVRDAAGNLTHYVGVFTDISSLKAHAAELERLAHFDPLTGVPNRRLLNDRLVRAVARARRSNKLLAVCYLDLDGFKPINDRHGHATGDQLLVEVTRRLHNTLREEDTLARIGGDEFVLLLGGISSIAESHAALDRVLAETSTPVKLGDETVSVSTSIGVTLFPLDDSDAETLLRHADMAMYEAKQAGRNCYRIFDRKREAAEIQSEISSSHDTRASSSDSGRP